MTTGRVQDRIYLGKVVLQLYNKFLKKWLDRHKKRNEISSENGHTPWMKIPHFTSIWRKWVPAYLNKVSCPEPKDEEELHLPFPIRCKEGLNQSIV